MILRFGGVANPAKARQGSDDACTGLYLGNGLGREIAARFHILSFKKYQDDLSLSRYFS
jgi:hypothetical protein